LFFNASHNTARNRRGNREKPINLRLPSVEISGNFAGKKKKLLFASPQFYIPEHVAREK
jgi:hypothetical protein